MLSSQLKAAVPAVQDAPKARRPLDKIAFNVSQKRTFGRFALRNELRSFTTVPRVKRCGHALAGNVGFVYLMRDVRGQARYHGLETCRRVWLCPVCAPRISFKRARLLEAQIARWLKSGHAVLFQTLTFPHDFGDPLLDSAQIAAKGFTFILRGRAWQDVKRRFGIVGTVRALEVTVGANGWHPHLHVLLFLKRIRGVRARRALQTHCFEKFAAAVEKAGFRRPDQQNCPLEVVDSSGVGHYVAKASGIVRELTSWHMKQARGQNRTAFQLLHDIAADNVESDRQLWGEWESGTYRRRQLTYSRGLRKLLGGEAELDPEGIIEREIQAIQRSDAAAITGRLWETIAARPGLDLTVQNAFTEGGYTAALTCLVSGLGPETSLAYLRENFLAVASVDGSENGSWKSVSL
jgi:hypothetical protein